MRATSIKLILASLFVSMFFIGCNDNSVGVDENLFERAEISEYEVMDSQDMMADLSDATPENDMKWNNNVPGRFGERFKKHRPGRLHFREIFRVLELSDEQKDQIKSILEAHHSVAGAIHETLKESVSDIIEASKAAREAIKAKVDAGELTREEARELIRQLNEETRAKIEATEAFTQAKAELCELKKQLLNDISGILSSDQLVKWNDWIGNLNDDCLNS